LKIEEIFSTNNKKITRFSIIGHSLGGLYARYAIGILLKNKFFEKVRPLNFITLATPHVGSRRSPRGLFNPLVNAFVRNAFNLTGRQLMLEDDEIEPLLMKMAEPAYEFFQALQIFPSRILYANVSHDIQVPYTTSAIVSRNPHTNPSLREKSFEQPEQQPLPKVMSSQMNLSEAFQVPYSTTPTESSYKMKSIVNNNPIQSSSEEAFSKDEKKFFLNKILRNLQMLQWNRIDVRFESFLSHELIVSKRDWMREESKQVLDHLSDIFALQQISSSSSFSSSSSSVDSKMS